LLSELYNSFSYVVKLQTLIEHPPTPSTIIRPIPSIALPISSKSSDKNSCTDTRASSSNVQKMTKRGYWPHDIARKMKETGNAKAKKLNHIISQARGDPLRQRQMD